MKQLSGMDASFLYFETPNAPGHVFWAWLLRVEWEVRETQGFRGVTPAWRVR